MYHRRVPGVVGREEARKEQTKGLSKQAKVQCGCTDSAMEMVVVRYEVGFMIETVCRRSTSTLSTGSANSV